jgi:hypothetical protein
MPPKGVVDSDNLPLNVSRLQRDQGRQLEDITEEDDYGDRRNDGVCDAQHQKFTMPIHETSNPVNAACLSISST